MMVHGFDMAGYGLAHWITFAVMAVVLLYPIGRILMRIGLSPFGPFWCWCHSST